MSTINGSIGCRSRSSTIEHLLLLVLLLLLALRCHFLFLEHLLALDSGKEIMIFEVFGVIMGDTLFLKLLEFL